MTWDYTTEEYKNQAVADERWHLERLINYGLGNEKLSRESLERHLPSLKGFLSQRSRALRSEVLD